MSRTIRILTPIRERPSLEYMLSLMKLQSALGQVHISFVTGNTNMLRTRNKLLQMFLDSDQDDALFWDDDVGAAPDVVSRLLESPKGFIGGVHRKKSPQSNHDPSAWSFAPLRRGQDGPGAMEVDWVGTGFLKISRETLETVIASRPDLVRSEGAPGEYKYRFFDMIFCRLVRSCGVSCWIDPEITLDHVGMGNYSGNVGQSLGLGNRFVNITDFNAKVA